MTHLPAARFILLAGAYLAGGAPTLAMGALTAGMGEVALDTAQDRLEGLKGLGDQVVPGPSHDLEILKTGAGV